MIDIDRKTFLTNVSIAVVSGALCAFGTAVVFVARHSVRNDALNKAAITAQDDLRKIQDIHNDAKAELDNLRIHNEQSSELVEKIVAIETTARSNGEAISAMANNSTGEIAKVLASNVEFIRATTEHFEVSSSTRLDELSTHLAMIGRYWASKPLHEQWRNRQRFSDSIPEGPVHVAGLDVSLESTGRPLILTLTGSSIGLDVGDPRKPGTGRVRVNVQIIRETLNEKQQIATATFLSDSSRILVPSSTFQAMDANPPIGECTYKFYVTTEDGPGIFYLGKGARMLAMAL